MVSLRCKLLVKEELERLGLNFVTVELGDVVIKENISSKQRERLKIALLKSGLELMDDKKAILIEKIKNVLMEMIHYSYEVPKINFSDFLPEKLKYDYTYLANHFSESTGVTIEHFIITHKIERVKELIIYDELNLTDIAFKMHYSSVSHLSNQFKKVTGPTPSFFKSLKKKKRIMLENV
ncbi:MAG: AraC family transcriptional regulator [Bacteroidota bacterium]